MSKVLTREYTTWESQFWPEGVPRTSKVSTFTLHEAILKRWARKDPSATALVEDRRAISYQELNEEVESLLEALKMNKGTVIVGLEKVADALPTFMAASERGLTTIFVDQSIIDEVKKRLPKDLQPAIKVVKRNDLFATEGQKDVSPATSRPSYVLALWDQATVTVRTHTKLVASLSSFSDFFQLSQGSLTIVSEPLKDALGLFQLLSVMYNGGTAVIAQGLQLQEYLRFVAEYRPSYLILSGKLTKAIAGLYRSLNKTFSSTSYALCPSKEISVEDQKGFQKLTGVQLLRCYLLNEVGILLANHPQWNVMGSLGIPITNVEARMVDVSQELVIGTGRRGYLIVNGPMVELKQYGVKVSRLKMINVKGLFGDYGKGWLHTGEYVEMNCNGMFYLVEEALSSR